VQVRDLGGHDVSGVVNVIVMDVNEAPIVFNQVPVWCAVSLGRSSDFPAVCVLRAAGWGLLAAPPPSLPHPRLSCATPLMRFSPMQRFAVDDGIPIRVSVVASDPDDVNKPEWSKLNYTIASSNDTARLFSLDTQTGTLTAASMIFNATSLPANYFGFNITVMDAGGLSTTVLVVRCL
jgi:hypothetical protein